MEDARAIPASLCRTDRCVRVRSGSNFQFQELEHEKVFRLFRFDSLSRMQNMPSGGFYVRR